MLGILQFDGCFLHSDEANLFADILIHFDRVGDLRDLRFALELIGRDLPIVILVEHSKHLAVIFADFAWGQYAIAIAVIGFKQLISRRRRHSHKQGRAQRERHH